MLGLLLIVLVVGMGLTALLWAGSVFLQGYFYTEPSPGMAWQAPAVGGGLTLFLMLWCVINALAPGATASQVPYDALFRAQTVEDYTKKPADRLWSYRKGQAKPTEYALFKTGDQKWDYRIPARPPGFKQVLGEEPPPEVGTPWKVDKLIEALELPDRNDEKQKIRFERRRDAEGPYAEFVSPEGWTMKAENNIGLPSAGSWGRFLAIVFLNLLHFAACGSRGCGWCCATNGFTRWGWRSCCGWS